MKRRMLKSRISGLVVSDQEPDEKTGLAIDEHLVSAAQLTLGGVIRLTRLNDGESTTTTLSPRCASSGRVVLRGQLAAFASPGDRLELDFDVNMSDVRTSAVEPVHVIVNESNEIV